MVTLTFQDDFFFRSVITYINYCRARQITIPIVWTAAMQKYWNKTERLNTHRTGLGHLNDRSFIALEHHYGERDVVRKRSRPYTE